MRKHIEQPTHTLIHSMCIKVLFKCSKMPFSTAGHIETLLKDQPSLEGESLLSICILAKMSSRYM